MKNPMVVRKRSGWKILALVLLVLVLIAGIGILVPVVFLRDDAGIPDDLRIGLLREASINQDAPLFELFIVHRRVQRIRDNDFMVQASSLFGIPVVRTVLVDCSVISELPV